MIRGFQIDLARQIERPEFLLESIRRLGTCGYNLCMLYLEDAYDYPGCLGIGRKHAYSPAFMQAVYSTCRETEMELVPVIPALGHCGYITGKPGYEKYDEGYEFGERYGTLVAGREDTYELMSRLFEGWCAHLPGKYIHVGLDESPHMGLSYVRKHGQGSFDAVAMFGEHGNRLSAIVKGLGRKMVMWGDMLYYFPDAIDRLDRDIIVADWYYYSFGHSPRVESFNFAGIDLSGDLKKAGFQVWGSPSVWPNYPFPDIADRLANLRSWQRYGKKCGIDGIVNTDWENSFGFFSVSELLFAAFERMWPELGEKTLPRALAETVEAMTGIKPDNNFIRDLLSLGNYHLTGHANRIMLTRPVIAMVSTAQPRIAEFRQKSAQLRDMFKNIDAMLEQCRRPEGQNLLKAIRLAHQLLSSVWRSCAAMSEIYSGLLEGRKSAAGTCAEIGGLADALSAFNADYSVFWDTVRFNDDRKSVSQWAVSAAEELRRLAERSNSQLPLMEHPLFMQPLLELELECFHPALPVLSIEIHWVDGTVQKAQEIMIKFESAYTVPDKNWRQYASIPLAKNQLPEEVVFVSGYYGQIGIRRAKITWQGTTREYSVYKTEGKNFASLPDALLIGPVGATPSDPTHRLECDKAYYRESGVFVK